MADKALTPCKESPQQYGDLRILDGLRGLMALWVVVGHACHFSALINIPLIRSPKYAVVGFMLLSGFLMTYHYILRAAREPWTEWRTWIAFYIRRFFRITPVYYLLLLPAYLLNANYDRWNAQLCALLHEPTFKPVCAAIDARHVLFHLSYIFGLLPAYHASLILPDWSLSLEMQFYFVFPLLMFLVLRLGWTFVTILCAAAYLLANWPALGYASQFMQPSALCLSILWFVIGMIWASIYLSGPQNKRLWIAISSLLSLLSHDLNSVLVIAVFAWLLFAESKWEMVALAKWFRKPLSGKVAKFLADASYSVYLLHLMILLPVAYYVATHFDLSPMQRWMICLSITVVTSYSSAWFLRSVEQWGIRVGKSLAKRIPQRIQEEEVQVVNA